MPSESTGSDPFVLIAVPCSSFSVIRLRSRTSSRCSSKHGGRKICQRRVGESISQKLSENHWSLFCIWGFLDFVAHCFIPYFWLASNSAIYVEAQNAWRNWWSLCVWIVWPSFIIMFSKTYQNFFEQSPSSHGTSKYPNKSKEVQWTPTCL